MTPIIEISPPQKLPFGNPQDWLRSKQLLLSWGEKRDCAREDNTRHMQELQDNPRGLNEDLEPLSAIIPPKGNEIIVSASFPRSYKLLADKRVLM